MPDLRKHRGPHPADQELFGPQTRPALREAVAHLSWLLSREYSAASALKLVGDRLRLTQRQRQAVGRSSCSEQARENRRSRQVKMDEIAGQTLQIDGFNLLTTVEAALAGAVILCARDGCYRDMCSMHGSYRKVEETRPALTLIGEVLEAFGAGRCHWYFDSPVSNSGRLGKIVREIAQDRNWNWQTELVADPDPLLAESKQIVVSADSEVLEGCGRWCNLAAEVVRRKIPSADVIDLSGDSASASAARTRGLC